jgi:hypothetical protein
MKALALSLVLVGAFGTPLYADESGPVRGAEQGALKGGLVGGPHGAAVGAGLGAAKGAIGDVTSGGRDREDDRSSDPGPSY